MIVSFSDHAANERTFLAWVRTVIAVVGFGVAAAGLEGGPKSAGTEFAMLITGAIVLMLAFLRMCKISRRITEKQTLASVPAQSDALLLFLVFSLLALLCAFALHVW